jgi:hypothetical protein
VFKDIRTRDYALYQGLADNTQVLHQGFLAEIIAVLLGDVKIMCGKAE